MVDRDIYFAVVGDVHGDIYTMLGLLQKANGIVSNICCLANVKKGKEAIAIFCLTTDQKIIEVTN